MADRDMPEFDELETDIMKNARNINSMSGQVQKLTEKDVRRVSSVKGEAELVSTTARVMRKMGEAVETMARGMKNVTVGSLRYTKEAVGQYSKAISEDVSVDKKNITALALTKSTPIFGYFAAKFMETDVFQKAAQNIKDQMGNAVSFVGAKLKTVLAAPFRGMSSLFKKRNKLPAESLGQDPKTGRRGTFVERDGKIHFHPIGRSKMTPMKIPKMAKGGYVEKGGLTRLHPAEVVMPIDKLLDRIDEKIENEADVRMNKLMRGVTVQQMRMMKRYMKTQAEVQTKSFTESYKDQYKTNIEPFNTKMMDAFSDLKTALLGQPNDIMISLKLMWQRFLSKHPVFLGMLRMGDMLLKTLAWPIKFLFKKRGGRLFRWVASKSGNPIVSTAETLTRFAPAALGYYDNMLTVLKDSLIVQKDLMSFFTGQRYGATILRSPKRWSFASILRDMAMGDVRRVGRWGKKAKNYLFGGGGGVEEMEESTQPITMTDRVDMMIDLLRDIANSSSRSTKEDTFKGYIKTDGIWQKKGIEVEKKQLNEQKNHRGFFGRMRNSLSFIGTKIKNLAIKIGHVVMKGLNKTISFVKGTIDTILAFIPGWLKIALGVAFLPTIANSLGEIFDKKILPVISKSLSTVSDELIKNVKIKLFGGEKTKEDFKKEESIKKKAIIAEGKEMKKRKTSSRDIAEYVSKKIKDEQTGASLQKRYEKMGGEELGLFGSLGFKGGQAFAKPLRMISGGYIDLETRLRNTLEEVDKGKMDPEKAGILYMGAMKKKLSPMAFTNLTKAGPAASAVDNFRTMMANKMVYNDNGIWITQDEWFKKRAGFGQKATAKIGRMMDSKSFGIFKLEEQFKDATSRSIDAKDLAERQEQKYAEYIKESMTPEAYRILTKDGIKGVADKLSTMIANNQLIEHEGKLNTAYQFLKKTGKLTWRDRLKYKFGYGEVSPADMLGKLAVKSIMTMEHGKEYMKQFMPVNPYSHMTTADLKSEIRKGGSNVYDYVKELMERLPKDQYSSFMKPVIGTPAFQKAMLLTADGKKKLKSITDIVNPAVKRTYDVLSKKVIEKADVASREAKSAYAKQRAILESNKKVQKMVDGTKEAYNNLNNSVSNMSSSITNNVSNSISNTASPRRDLIGADADLLEMAIGDLK